MVFQRSPKKKSEVRCAPFIHMQIIVESEGICLMFNDIFSVLFKISWLI